MVLLCLCGGPCHLSSFKQLVYSLMAKTLYYNLINVVNVKILGLNLFSKTTQCPFNMPENFNITKKKCLLSDFSLKY